MSNNSIIEGKSFSDKNCRHYQIKLLEKLKAVGGDLEINFKCESQIKVPNPGLSMLFAELRYLPLVGKYLGSKIWHF